MMTFSNGDWYNIKGRGHVYATTNPEDCKDFAHILNHEVEIEGNIYFVVGVEFMGFTSRYKGGAIGLLIQGPVANPHLSGPPSETDKS